MKISAKKPIWLICSFLLLYPAIKTYSFPLDLKNCENSNYLLQHPHQVLLCAAKVLPTLSSQLSYLGEEKTTQYTQYKYSFASIIWPKIFQTNTPDVIKPNVWKHEIDIFVPKENPKVDTAALYITGGYSNSKIIRDNSPDKIISQLIQHNIVIVLKDNPNQYLTINNKPLKEDEIIAFTWNRFIHNPKLSYYPLHIPMAIAAQQAMTLAQNILQQHHICINHFVVIGASKRGWATWMTALLDHRVIAMIPIVVDVLNLKKQIPHIYNVYAQHWPIALNDYNVQHIPEYANPNNIFYSNYLKLLQLEDPFSYFTVAPYQKKLAEMSKYIVNASGDDFFPPDSSQYYYAALSEKKLLFYLPNSGHYIEYSPSVSQLASTLSAFYKRIISHQALPVITWNRTEDGLKIDYSEKPSKIILWSAENPITRDFRYSCAIHYQPTDIMVNGRVSKLKIQTSKQGWSASYVELDFPDGLRVSTPIFISPNTYPKKNQIMPPQGMCLLINPEHKNVTK
ncbi:PhoPQ-activated protein PqaA family protein [Rickettsiella endosymbiont of Miltochrista miniata]|uniref:PhoPQ-activated protein PqaA family protein n=1 Tax=Rickettsiella endosymbiont of Miltochrista miniata TaxID=3066239 RepID=UPI00313A880A